MPDERDVLDPVADTEERNIEIEIPAQKTKKEREEEKARRLAEIEEEQRRKKEEEQRQKEYKQRKFKRKLITPFIMLFVGAISSITMYFRHFENARMLIWLLVILLVSSIVGRLIQFMFDEFARKNEEALLSEEGEVITKGMVSEEETDGESS